MYSTGLLPSICNYRCEEQRKMGRPRSIHHVSGHKGGHEVDVGKEGPIFKCVRTKLESGFLTSQDKYFQLHEHLEF